MTEQQKKDSGYDNDKKNTKVKDKKLEKNKIKNSLKNNNTSNGMHNNSNDNNRNAIPLTKEHYIGELRGKKSEDNPREYSKSQYKLSNALVMINNKTSIDNNNIENNNENNINGPFDSWGNPTSAPYKHVYPAASFTMAALNQ